MPVVGDIQSFQIKFVDVFRSAHACVTFVRAQATTAELAFKALMEEIQHAEKKTNFEYKTRFVLRESTCAPRSWSMTFRLPVQPILAMGADSREDRAQTAES